MAKAGWRSRQYAAVMRMAKRTEHGDLVAHEYWVTKARQMLAAIARRVNKTQPVKKAPV